MANTLLHEVEVEDAYTVETVGDLRNALHVLIGLANETYLSNSYRIELISERLSDGSKAYEIQIREAERV